jgi:hypothetical protein
MSANDPRILIGLGEARAVESVEIRWPSGARSTLAGPEAGREHTVVEPSDGAPPGIAAGRADEARALP